MSRLTIIYFLPDEALGVATIVKNLLEYRKIHSNFYYKVILTRQLEREAQHIDYQFNADEQLVFKYSGLDNLTGVLKRLKGYIPNDKSILVANDGLELRMVNYFRLQNPVIYIIHGDFDYYYKISRLYQGVIDKFIAYSLQTEARLIQLLNPEDLHHIELLYYPVPEKPLRQIQPKSLDLLFVGSFVDRKGVQFLPEIYKSIKDKLGNISFKIAGFGKLEPMLKSGFRNESTVQLVGKVSNDDVFRLMMEAKVLVFPSLSEGLPNVVVEAMKCGCVPVCSDIKSGIPDLIDHGIEGFIVDTGNVTRFAEHIVKLLENEKLLHEMAFNAANKAHEMFKPNKNAENYENAVVNTVAQTKSYVSGDLGRLLNHPIFPNFVVKQIRKLGLSTKL
ncbi:Glycosyltransferase involved in cell wall bisynthesis [Flavobacteriaceae bacterium MAR_2010_188]|nr:Glycosyltransferase involved in cell wall bisynthesis [Flavobacteriaceae bacterium MAR_2010_188]